MKPAIRVLPSLLAADMGRLEEACVRAREAGADALHLDIMDGHFVPNISFGPAVVAMARRCFGPALSVHLMVTRPDLHLRAFAEAGAEVLLIHAEAPCDVAGTLRDIRSLGIRAGLTLNPETPARFADRYLEAGLLDEILCMSVHPGFGGQAFIPNVLPKLAALRRRAPTLDLSIDGGIDAETGPRAAAQGANLFIAGTALFGAGDMAAEVRRYRERLAAAFAPEPPAEA